MIDNIKLGAKIMAKASFKWALITFSGTFFSFLYFLLGIYASWDYFSGLSSGHGIPAAGHTGVFGAILIGGMFVISYFLYNFCAFLLVLGLPVFLVFYSKLAMSTTIDSVIFQLWNSNAGIYVTEKVEAIVNRITEKVGWRKDFSDGAISKVKLLNSLKSDPDCPKMLKKVIKYGINIINLEDVNFNDENLKLTDVVMTKFNNAASEIEKPSLKLFWILLLAHTSLMIGAFILK